MTIHIIRVFGCRNDRVFKALIATIILLFSTLVVIAQDDDRMRTLVLDEIVFEVKTEGDTLQNFYKSNASATTENTLSRM